jgi:hypothetical protein
MRINEIWLVSDFLALRRMNGALSTRYSPKVGTSESSKSPSCRWQGSVSNTLLRFDQVLRGHCSADGMDIFSIP